jgi:CheY-like chemotaxis protein
MTRSTRPGTMVADLVKAQSCDTAAQRLVPRAMNDESTNGRPQILVVDDNPGEVKALCIGLELEGFMVNSVTEGQDALTRLSENPYSAVLIDMMMPGMNGLELARAVRDSHPAVPTILMSAYHLSPVQLARADTGAVGFVPKPFDFEELVRFIRRKIGLDPERDLGEPGGARPGRAGLATPFDVPKSAG